MCLTLKKFSFKHKAKKDITVYKTLVVTDLGEYKTPYQEVTVKIGRTYSSKLIKESYNGRRDDFYCDYGLHSYKELESIGYPYNVYTVAECIIPKGSYYYKGMFLSHASYASDKLTYVKIID